MGAHNDWRDDLENHTPTADFKLQQGEKVVYTIKCTKRSVNPLVAVILTVLTLGLYWLFSCKKEKTVVLTNKRVMESQSSKRGGSAAPQHFYNIGDMVCYQHEAVKNKPYDTVKILFNKSPSNDTNTLREVMVGIVLEADEQSVLAFIQHLNTVFSASREVKVAPVDKPSSSSSSSQALVTSRATASRSIKSVVPRPLKSAGQLYPAWFGKYGVNEWFAIPNTTHAGSPAAPDDDPNNIYVGSNFRLSYSGFALAGTQVVLAATGGHSDYSGNEVTGIDLSSDTPTWALLHAATPVSGRVPNVPYYPDGTPASRHAYNNAHFSTTHNRLVVHHTTFVWSEAISFTASNGFNLDNNAWDPAGTFSEGHSGSCRDAYDNVWATGNYFELYKWTAATDTWARTGVFSTETSSTMAHDSKRDQIFQFSWGDGIGDGSGVWANIYTQNGTVQTPITFPNSPALQQFQADAPSNNKLEYDPIGDQFLFWNGINGRMYVIIPNNTTNWDMMILQTTGTTPPPTLNSMSRMALVPQLGGCVVMPAGTDPLYFIRLY